MAVSPPLRRLLRIRCLEEEQSRLALESAIVELNRLEQALTVAVGRDRRGRRLVETSVRTGELADRLAGLDETRVAVRRAAALAPRIAAAELDVARLRQGFMEKRVERRQADTLISETEARDAIEDGRRGQQALDDWYRFRLHRADAEAEPNRPAIPVAAIQHSNRSADDTR